MEGVVTGSALVFVYKLDVGGILVVSWNGNFWVVYCALLFGFVGAMSMSKEYLVFAVRGCEFFSEFVLVGVAVCKFWVYILLLRGCVILGVVWW